MEKYQKDKILNDVMSRIIEVEGGWTTIEEFIKVNSAPDVEPLEESDYNKVFALNVNEETYIGIVPIKRIA